MPLIQDDWEIYAKDPTELSKATDVRRLFVDYDRPFDGDDGDGVRDGKSDKPNDSDMELLDATPPVRSVPDPFHHGDTDTVKGSESANQKSGKGEPAATGISERST